MGLTFRSVKGTSLTHTELDNNFREFFYSGSVSGSSIVLYRSQSLNNRFVITPQVPSGSEYNIQYKVGNGDYATFGGRKTFIYDHRQDHLKLTGSFTLLGDSLTQGNTITEGSSSITQTLVVEGSITGSTDFNTLVNKPTLLSSSITEVTGQGIFSNTVNGSGSIFDLGLTTGSTPTFQGLVVNGTIDAVRFNTTFISSSVLVTSGSNIFGDEPTDVHEFTGSVRISGSTEINNTLTIPGFVDVSASLAAIQSSATGLTAIVEDTTPTLGGDLDLSGSNVIGTGSIDISGSLNLTGNISGSTGVFTGDIETQGDIIAFSSSDRDLKDNITPISNPIDKIKQIGGYEFDWNDKQDSYIGHDVGVIAQEIENILPELVRIRSNGFRAVKYDRIVALLIEAIKDQQKQIDELKSKL